MSFGATLRSLRIARNLTQEELAERAGLTANGVSALERGARTRPQPHTLRVLAEALDLDAGMREQFLASAREQVSHAEAPAAYVAPAYVAPPEHASLDIAAPPSAAILGRDREVQRLRPLLLGARTSSGGAFVVHGEAGVGKSTLLAALASEATGFTILRTQGNETEAPLAYAALHRLLMPLLDERDRLPPRQRKALAAVFGIEDGDEEGNDRFLVFLAALALLTEAAERRPVLCVVDDAHWLDDASSAALQFIARRVQREPVALLFGARDGGARRFEARDLPALRLQGLDRTSAEQLLTAVAPRPVSAEVRAELYARTDGNPLALVEIPAALTDGQLAGEARLPSHLPLTDGLERVFLDRFQRLPDAARTLLLLASADDSGQLPTVLRAAELVGASEGLSDAEKSGLLSVSGVALQLRHPLVRSAVYSAATSVERRRAHGALAHALAERGELERAVWHRADARDQPDEETAAELEAIARRAGQNGGHEAASAAWERAAELTPTSAARAERIYQAALSAWFAVDSNRTRRLAQIARATTQDEVLLADIDTLRGMLELHFGSPRVGHGILLRAARDVAHLDGGRARKLAMIATAFAAFGFDSGVDIDPTTLAPPASTEPDPYARAVADLLDVFAALLRDDLHAARDAFRLALIHADGLHHPDVVTNIGSAALHLGADDEAARWHDVQVDDGRERAALSAILHALTRRTLLHLSIGDFRSVSAAAGEVLDIAATTNQPNQQALPLAELLLIGALQGRAGFADDLKRAEQALAEHPPGALEGFIRDTIAWARSVDAATPAIAVHHLQQVSHPIMRRITAIDRMEAAVHAGQHGIAAAVVEDLAAFAAATGAVWAAAAADHGRALLAEGEEVEAHFLAALARSEENTRLFNRARTRLAFGEHLRRGRRRADAREHLRAALAEFETLGIQRWAERAAAELRAAGEAGARPADADAARLAPQEVQVARLVQQGLSNRDVAARLFVSPRTVEFHLRNVFAKLGISSRGALVQINLDSGV